MLKNKLTFADIILKILIAVSLSFFVYRTLPAFLYCMYYRYDADIFYDIFTLADFSYHYEFVSAEYLYNIRFVCTFVGLISVLIFSDMIFIFRLRKNIITIIITTLLYILIISVTVCIASNVGYSAWIYQY